jgi:hypothetical protein
MHAHQCADHAGGLASGEIDSVMLLCRKDDAERFQECCPVCSPSHSAEDFQLISLYRTSLSPDMLAVAL